MSCLRFNEFFNFRVCIDPNSFEPSMNTNCSIYSPRITSARLLYADFIIAVVNPEPSLDERNDKRH